MQERTERDGWGREGGLLQQKEHSKLSTSTQCILIWNEKKVDAMCLPDVYGDSSMDTITVKITLSCSGGAHSSDECSSPPPLP